MEFLDNLNSKLTSKMAGAQGPNWLMVRMIDNQMEVLRDKVIWTERSGSDTKELKVTRLHKLNCNSIYQAARRLVYGHMSFNQFLNLFE